MKTLILVCGTMRSGKDTVGSMIMDEFSSSRIVDITSYLKRGVGKMLNLTSKQVDLLKDDAVVEITVDEENDGVTEAVLYSEVTIRRILQYQADICRDYITCEKALEELMQEDRDCYILTGVRIPREVEFIKKVHADKRVIALKVVRADYENRSPDQSHMTETLVGDIKADYTIEARNLPELRLKTEDFINYIKDGQN